MQFGVQLYGLSALLKRDPRQLFGALAGAGYRFVEPCVAIGELGGFERTIWTPEELEASQPTLRELGLSIRSCHVFARDLWAEIPKLCEWAEVYGIKQFITKCPDDLSAASCRVFARECARATESLAQHGAQLLLHNEFAEILTRVEGMTAYEWIVAQCGGLVLMQPDVGWLLYGGEDPEAFLWRNREHIASLHYKDVRGRATDCAPGQCGVRLGEGLVDGLACFQFARACGVPQLVDQDMSDGNLLQDTLDTWHLLDSWKHRRDRTDSELCTLDVQTGETQCLHSFDGIMEAPNWLNEDTLLYNRDGGIYRYSIATGESARVDTGACDGCNNDHAPSWDGRYLAISHAPKDSPLSRVYTLPITGGEPRLVTPNAPSYLHGWSPDGRELAYCAFRPSDGGMAVDLYTIPVAGGDEKRLTDGTGYNDGAEYTPDGRYIWYNSTRSGLMQAWRMRADGSQPEQMTFGESNQWFPHLSPDGRQVAFLSYYKEDLEPAEHLPNMRASLWLMPAEGGTPRKLLDLFGGQGSCNVNSWSPDSRRLAFVRYRLKTADDAPAFPSPI